MNAYLVFDIGVVALLMVNGTAKMTSGKENLQKDDQQYGEWLQADPTQYTRKTVAVISGASFT